MNLDTEIAKGNTASLYLCNNSVIKLFHETYQGTESLHEADKQRFAYSCGLPVPKVEDVVRINGRQAIIMELVQGRTIGDLLSGNMDKAEEYLSISVDSQQEIHRIEAPSIEPMREKLSRQIQDAPLPGHLREALIRKMNAIRFEKKLCHGDFYLFNLIMGDSKVTILDWVDSSAGDPRADVYRTYLLYLQYSTELAERYVQLYCEKSALSKEEILQWAPIIAGARLSENVSSDNRELLCEIVCSETK
ncbi:aminoglycoside phosphotransferase family protein [Bacillus sp. FJAT-42376]|uniref:phosphotransferase family protein n=1 Tax=Bacillus sp. FJAT-42376 TaxID=2014076 RepID=UPI000F508A6A|nr:aminoglycoside phosphotransferase family protein [Bacillus sp. FJAT-42376]AZB44750.1 aminoglycoside phosphotransferase family protein [Bacillus sp. FJAT-42376]